MTATCTQCGASMPVGAYYCDKCGGAIQADASQANTAAPAMPQVTRRIMKCVSCRLTNYSGETSCKRCGGQLVDREAFVQEPQVYQPTGVAFQPGDSQELGKANALIKKAVGAGIFAGVVTLIVALLAAAGVDIFGKGASLTGFFDVALAFGLTFGISRKSRVCAVLMLIYFVVSKILMFSQTGTVAGIPLALFLIYCFAQGVQGTFTYHKLRAGQTTPGLNYSRIT